MNVPVILRSDKQRAYAKRLIDEAPVDAVVRVNQPTRSNIQNARLWAMLGDVSNAKPEGRSWTPETWKSAFMQVLGHQVRFCDGLDNSGPFPLGFKSSQLTVREMADLITVVGEYGDRHGVRWTDPSLREVA